MKKSIIKVCVFILTFVIALFVGGRIMNKGHNNLTMEMAGASLPVITMGTEGRDYNQLFGYQNTSNTAFQRDTVTVLGQSRDTTFTVEIFGKEVTAMSIEVRSMDGSRLIEDTPVTDYEVSAGRIRAKIALKDLIEKDTEYSLAIVLELNGEEQVRYYTRVIWSDNAYLKEKLDFILDFHEKLYDKEAAKELTKYLEPNSQLADNKSFHKVNIHSSFKQITWGDLNVKEVTQPVIQLTETSGTTASVLLDYIVSTKEGKNTVYYRIKEYYRVRYTSERMYLLDYERTMTQMPEPGNMYANDKILLGITDRNISMAESADGNTVVFEVAKQLISYNAITNKLTRVFSFYNEQNHDVRDRNDRHNIKILDVDEVGNIRFAVYGYMNRGRHEGETGLQIYMYDSTLNTLEEIVYIPYEKTYAVMQREMDDLLYLNRDQKLYLFLENTVYGIDLVGKTYQKMVTITQDDSLQVSESHKIIVWQEGDDIYNCRQLKIRNLSSDMQYEIRVDTEEAIRPLGFMEEDIIYGVARKSDIVRENSGRVFFPMYKLCISDSNGKLLKEYTQSGMYITNCTVENNQITMQRLERKESGVYEEAPDDHIMDNTESEAGKNTIIAADIDVYERYVEIQTKTTIDSKTIKILTPKEVVFEGGRELRLEAESETPRYYVYGPYGVEGIYSAPAKAVNRAYELSGAVVNNDGNRVWLRSSRVARNQIMAIKEAEVSEGRDSLAVCLDTILNFEGLIRDSSYLMSQGQTVMDILENNLENVQVLDLTGCNLDTVLYYVNQDIPVLAMLEDGKAVLLTGFNEFNVVIMDPSEGTLEKKGMNDSTQWFEENGNRFVTYMRLK